MSVRAVIWDFGGVFTTSPFERFATYEASRNIPVGFIRSVNATNPNDNAWAKFERSEVDLDAFDGLFLTESTALGHPIPGKDVIALLSGSIRPQMVRALDMIRADRICACITNNVRAGRGPGIAKDAGTAAEIETVMARFQFVIESSVVGLRKPDPRIYQLACEKLGVQPSEAVYLDDLGINLKPAKALGMQTIKVTGAEQALTELGAILGMDLLG
ncbi:MAG: HAD-IA family hydrolase [Pseudomonadota bacterium]|nr:HAD-IA family hydrolase [Pseudomonadota bacterium]